MASVAIYVACSFRRSRSLPNGHLCRSEVRTCRPARPSTARRVLEHVTGSHAAGMHAKPSQLAQPGGRNRAIMIAWSAADAIGTANSERARSGSMQRLACRNATARIPHATCSDASRSDATHAVAFVAQDALVGRRRHHLSAPGRCSPHTHTHPPPAAYDPRHPGTSARTLA